MHHKNDSEKSLLSAAQKSLLLAGQTVSLPKMAEEMQRFITSDGRASMMRLRAEITDVIRSRDWKPQGSPNDDNHRYLGRSRGWPCGFQEFPIRRG